MENKRFNAPFSFKGYIDRTEWIISKNKISAIFLGCSALNK